MSKIEAKQSLLNNYLDEYGRVKTSLGIGQNSLEMRYENNNMLLFSGEALILLKKNNLLDYKSISTILAGIFKCEHEVFQGLYSRHPMPYRISPHLDIISHDEYNGVMYAVAACPQFTVAADDILDYEKKYGSFCDLYPGISFSSAFKKKPLTTIKNVIKLIKMLKNKEDYRFKVGEAEILTYKRQPRDRAFYKIISEKYKPSLFEIIFMCMSTLSTLKKPVDHVRGSGRLMAIYRMWSIEEKGLTNKLHCAIINLTNKLFRKGLKKQYGENYIEALHTMYFNLDKNHPFHELCKGLK